MWLTFNYDRIKVLILFPHIKLWNRRLVYWRVSKHHLFIHQICQPSIKNGCIFKSLSAVWWAFTDWKSRWIKQVLKIFDISTISDVQYRFLFQYILEIVKCAFKLALFLYWTAIIHNYVLTSILFLTLPSWTVPIKSADDIYME